MPINMTGNDPLNKFLLFPMEAKEMFAIFRADGFLVTLNFLKPEL